MALRTPPFDRLILARGTPATLYASDGTSGARAFRLVASSARQTAMIGSRGDVIPAHVPSTLAIVPGQVVQAPLLPAGWYVVAKCVHLSRTVFADTGTSILLLALPFTLSTKRSPVLSASQRNPYGGPLEPVGPAVVTVRCGYSNQFDPLSETVGGPLPAGSATAYVPLLADVRVGDETALPDGTPMVVQQANHLYADGTPYALQLVMQESAGAGW